MVAFVLCFFLFTPATAGPGGYHFLEGYSHTTIHFERYKDLIVIPAQLNDTMRVNLILDTGTRSLLLYGKRFRKLQNIISGKKVKVSGWGSPEGVEAALSYPNGISIGEVRGSSLGVAVVTSRKLFAERPRIDGIIGYELFVRFVVEINYKTQTIHLYDKMPIAHTSGFRSLPLEVNKARPQVTSTIHLKDRKTVSLKLLIDTGSSLGLTLFCTNKEEFYSSDTRRQIGIGLNGLVRGFELYVSHFFLGDMKIERVPSYLVDIVQHPDANFTFAGSLGAAFLRDHIVIFDYPGNRLFLRNRRDISDAAPIVALPW